MLLDANNGCHLTYCSNIHPGESWPELRATLADRLPAVRRELDWRGPFGVGLRVAAQAAATLGRPQALDELREVLSAGDLYVFTLNGFPYGPFHGTRVKEDVYLPDWRARERVEYTRALTDLLAAVLPDEPGLTGSISTVPGAYKARVTAPEHVQAMVEHLVESVAHTVEVERRSGVCITLALEPEPCCFLETIAECVSFFTDHLFADAALDALAGRVRVDRAQANVLMRRHLGLCLDLCHAAVEYESAPECIAALAGAGIAVHKMQVSAGLSFADVGPATRELLEPFNDAVYLHQVVARAPDGVITRFTDLPEAFDTLTSAPPRTQWRVHFHVPIFLDDLGAFSSTQAFIRNVLAMQRRAPISTHLEVETYTWDVLPPDLRAMPVEQAIARELSWTAGQLGVAQ